MEQLNNDRWFVRHQPSNKTVEIPTDLCTGAQDVYRLITDEWLTNLIGCDPMSYIESIHVDRLDGAQLVFKQRTPNEIIAQISTFVKCNCEYNENIKDL